MRLNPPKPKHTIYVVLQEYVQGKRPRSRSLTVYGVPLDEVYDKIRGIFEEDGE